MLAVLELVHMWEFQKIKASIIAKLNSDWDSWIDCVEKIVTAQKYEIKAWYPLAYFELANRCTSITVKEAEQLGLSFTIRMTQIREGLLLRREHVTRKEKECCVHCKHCKIERRSPSSAALNTALSGSSVKDKVGVVVLEAALVQSIKETFGLE